MNHAQVGWCLLRALIRLRSGHVWPFPVLQDHEADINGNSLLLYMQGVPSLQMAVLGRRTNPAPA